MYQRFGRLWRDYTKKHNITYYCFLPFEAKFKSEDEREMFIQLINTFMPLKDDPSYDKLKNSTKL